MPRKSSPLGPCLKSPFSGLPCFKISHMNMDLRIPFEFAHKIKERGVRTFDSDTFTQVESATPMAINENMVIKNAVMSNQC